MKMKKTMSLLISFAMLGTMISIPASAETTAFENGTNTITASKTAQWKQNGGGKDTDTYDLLISYYSANMYQTAYMGFELPSEFEADYVQGAKLMVYTTKLGTSTTASVYAAGYDAFDNGVQYEGSAAPAFDSAAIGSFTSPAVGEWGECDVTDYIKSASESVAFRIASAKGYTGWNIGSCNNGGPAPQLVIEYDNGEGAHTVPESIVCEHGAITFDKTGSFEAGEEITFTAVPDAHYALDTLTVDGEAVSAGEDNTYTFIMPARNITASYITATFVLKDYMKMRNIYEDNMLLQRDKPVYIDGTCQNINSAEAYLYNGDETVQQKTVTVDGDEWNVTFDAVSDYTGNYRIVIEGDNGSVEMDNVLFGDVYLFSGQSNMWKEVSYYKSIDPDFKQSEVEKHLSDKIRVMYTKGSGCYGETNPCYDAAHKSAWTDFSSYSKVSELPAVTFSGAVRLYEETNIPIGVISNAYPGSYISCWFPNTGIDACNSNRNKNSNERNWYNGRIYPIRNLRLSGIFWYQGEADSATTYHSQQYDYYTEMMPRLINDWRALFNDEQLPFYYVELCRLGHNVDENNPDTTSSGEVAIRQAQTDTYSAFADKTNIGIVGTLDIYGRYEYPETKNDMNCRNDIHPAQKKLVGERLANFALKDIYGKDVYTMGPIAEGAEAAGGAIVVTYNCSGSLKIMDSAQYADTVTDTAIAAGTIDASVLNEFEIAGADGVWYKAEAEITAANQVTVSSENVAAPTQVRYAYSDYSDAPNLTDESGLPSYVFCMAVSEQEESEKEYLLNEDFSAPAEYWTTLTSGANVSLSAADGYLKANTGNGNGARTGAITLGENYSKDYMELAFDFKAANFNSSYTAEHGFDITDADGNAVLKLRFPNHRNGNAAVTLNGTELTGVTLPYRAESAWYTLTAKLDLTSHRMGYAVTDASGREVFSMPAVTMASNAAAGINKIAFYVNRGYNSDYVEIDNFKISEITDPGLEAPPLVESLNIRYECDGAAVKTDTITLENAYEGNKYTYISSNYIKGDDGNWYYIASDYSGDTENKLLNNATTPVNNALIKTIDSLAADSVIIYEVKPAAGIMYFTEFEDALDTAAADAPNGRYVASGGKMTSVSGTKEITDITEDGYYEVILVGCPQGSGTGIFKNAEAAAAASAYDEGIVGIKYTKNDYYGIYSASTVYLSAGDKLTLRGFGTNGANEKLDYIAFRRITEGTISGTDGVSIIPGMTAQFTFESGVKDAPVWSVEGEGLSIDQNGLLTVSENAKPGEAVIKAVIGNNAVTAEKTVTVAAPEIVSYKFVGTTAMNLGDEVKYYAANVKDRFGNDITAVSNAVFAGSNESITVSSDGAARAVGKGSTDIIMTLTAGSATVTETKTVVSDIYYIIAPAAGETTRVDISALVKSDSITGWRVTTADAQRRLLTDNYVAKEDVITGKMTVNAAKQDSVAIYAAYDESNRLKEISTLPIKAGEAVKERDGYRLMLCDSLDKMNPSETETAEADFYGIEAATAGAAYVEVSPVYEYTFAEDNGYEPVPLADTFAVAEYDLAITKTTFRQTDLYLNGYMIGNNVDENDAVENTNYGNYNAGREWTEEDKTYIVNDILVDDGTMTFTKDDCSVPKEAGIAAVTVKKSPSIANRKQKLYIIGDSLVAIYYGRLKENCIVGNGRSGWGQVLQSFIDDEVEVVNFANAGQYASGLQVTAFPGLIHTAHKGDYMIIESGWNDLQYSSFDEMYKSVTEMVDECEANGIRPILVTPNASVNTWSSKADVRLSSAMRAAAATAQEKYDDVIFIDLAQLSYDYLCSLYGNDTAMIDRNFSLMANTGRDNLHLSYLAAMKWAEVVAQGMYDAGVGFVNTDFTWSVTDTEGNEIVTQVKGD